MLNFKKYLFLFLWLHQVLAAAPRIFFFFFSVVSYELFVAMWDLVP